MGRKWQRINPNESERQRGNRHRPARSQGGSRRNAKKQRDEEGVRRRDGRLRDEDIRQRPGRKPRDESGQMTVELAVAFPVVLVVAIIAVNALLFFSECAAFDRLACASVRVHVAAPGYGVSPGAACGQVQQELATSFDKPYLEVSVSSAATGFDYLQVSATLDFAPTLFGMGLRSEVFGVGLPHLMHTVSYVVDPYRPGVIV